MTRLRVLQIRNWLLSLTFLVSLVSLITEYLVEVLLIDSIGTLLADFLDLFSVNLEASIPTWYATILLFVAGVLLLSIAVFKWRDHDRFRRHWSVLALGFIYLSMDEGAQIHEIFVDPAKQAFDLSGFFEFGWQIFAIPVVIVVLAFFVRFTWQLPSRTRALFVVSAGIYLGGALFFEGISASLWGVNNGLSLSYLAIATIEETFEMLGIVLFIYALLDYMRQCGYEWILRDTPSDAPPQKSYQRIAIPRLIPVLIVLNALILGWMVGQTQPLSASTEVTLLEIPFYYSIQADVLADDGIIMDIHGVFGIDNPESRQYGAMLLDQYPYVIAISQPLQDGTTLIATHTMTFNRDDLTTLLHAIGQTNYIIFETETVRAISQIP